MKQAQRKSFDWYKMQQRFSIRKYHFGAASVLLGTALVLGAGAKAQTVQANEHYAEVTNSVSVDKIAEATKPVEVSTTKKETTYAAPTVANPVEVTPAKTEEATRPAEKVEEPKVEKEEVSHQSAVDKSKLLTALSRARKLDDKLYTEASVNNLQASIQAGQSLIGKAGATESEVAKSESAIRSAIIGLEVRSSSDRGTVTDTPLVKQDDTAEAKEEDKATTTRTDRSATGNVISPTSTPAKVEATSSLKSSNEILKPGFSLSDAHQNPAIRKEDLDKGYSGFRAAGSSFRAGGPENRPILNPGNAITFSNISQGSHSFRGIGHSRNGEIHFDVTTVRYVNRVDFTIKYSSPGEFVNNNFILDKGAGYGEPSSASISTRYGTQTKRIGKRVNFVSHSGYTLDSASETNTEQTIRFSLPITNPSGDLSLRLRPVAFNVDQGAGGAATSNDPYSNSNYYYETEPLYLDANPTPTNPSTASFTTKVDFQTLYIPTTKLAEGATELVSDGEEGEKSQAYRLHKLGNQYVLGLPVGNPTTVKVAKPRIMKYGIGKIAAVQNKVGDTNHITFYLDKDGDGNYNAEKDELILNTNINDGQRGPAGPAGATGQRGPAGPAGATGQQGPAGRDGKSLIAVKNGNETKIYEENPARPGQPLNLNRPLATITDGRDGTNGQSPTITATRSVQNGKNGVLVTITPVGGQSQTTFVEDGQKGADGKTPTVTITDGQNGTHTLTVHNPDGRDETTIIRDGQQGPAGPVGPAGTTGPKGADGITPTVTVTNGQDGTHTITINDGKGGITNTVVKNGLDGFSPLVSTRRNEADKTTTVIFYYDQNGNNEFDAGDTKLKEVVIADGVKGERGDRGETGAAGRDGKTPKITTARGADGRSTDITFTIPGEEPVTVNVKDGKDGRTPTIDLNALAEAAVRLNNQRSGRVRRALADAPSTAPAPQPVEGTRITAYYDNNGNGKYDPGVDELIGTSDILNGTNGRNGADGASGTDGRNGADGASGTDGRNGAELLSGPKAPTANDGKDGDTYIDATTGDVYKKEGRNWNQIGNIRGPQGLPGPKGDKGENGRDGFTPEVTVTDNHDGSHTITVTQPEGRPALTTIVKNGVDGQTPKVKAVRDEAKKQTTLTFYIDKDGDGNYTEGTDTLVQTSIVKDGQDGAAGQAGRDGKEVLNGKVDPQPRDGKDGDSFVNTATGDVFVKKNNAWEQAGNIKGPKGNKGENGRDGFTPEVTVTDNHDGSHTITVTQPEGRPALTTIVKNGVDGQTPKVKAERDEAKKQTTLTFYIDKDGDGNYTEGTDTLVQTSIVKDGQDGAAGQAGRDGKSLLTVKEGKETKVYQEDPANPGQPLTPDRPLAVIRDGVDGKSPTVTAARKEEVDHKGVEITVDNHDGSQPTTVFVHDGAKGETGANGQNGQTPTVTTQRGADGHSTVVTITTPGKEPVTFTVRDGLDGHNGNNGRTPKIDLQPYVNGEDSFRRARRSVGNNPDEVSGHPNSRATSSDNADGTHVTVYFDNNGNNHYDPGVDELISERDVLNGVNGENGASGRDGRNGSELLSGNIAPTPKDGKNGDTYIDSSTGDVYKKQNGAWNKTGNIRGPQGAKGDTPEVTAKPGADGHSTDITITTPGKDPVTVNVKNGKDGKSLIAKKEGNETKIFVEDPERPGQPLDSTKPLATVLDGLKGDKGENGADGKSPVVTVTDNGDGTHSITVRNGDGSESTTKVKDGKDGKTATITTTENPDGSHTITVTNPDGTSKETVVKNGKDGKTPKVEVTDNNDGTHTVKVTDGEGNITNAIIKDGKDGKSASATTRENPDGSHTVTITNPDGTKNEFVVKNGRDGVDGRTPTASVRDNGDGSHTIVITNPEGVTTETTVRDGKSPKVTITDEQNGTHKISVLNGDGTTTETIVKDGKSPVATVTDNHDGTYTIRVENGNGTVSETTVRDGKSPTAKVVDNGDGTHTITVVNSDGTTTTTTVRDGKEPKLEVIDNNNGSHTIKVTGADGKETTTTIFDGKSPKANIVDNGDGTHTLTIVDSDGREYKSIIKDGKDGVSPTVTVKNNNDGTHVVTITNPDGSKTEMVIKDGKDGKSPKVSVEDNGNGSHTITIINSDGTVTKTVVKDGKDGRDGRDGKDGKDGKCGCQDKPVTPSNDKPVPPTRNVPQGPTFAMPEPPVYELPEFNGGVPGMPEVAEVPELDIPTVPAQPTPEVPVKPVPAQPTPNVPTPEVPVQPTPVVPTPEVPVKPVPAVPEQPVVPTPDQPATPVNANPVVPTTVKENHGDKLPETGSQSDYISVLLGSGILLSLYVGRRKED